MPIMKNLSLLLLITIASQAFSQSIFPYEKVTYFEKGNRKNTHQLYKEVGVKEEQVLVKKSKNKAEKLSWERTYSANGNNLSYKRSSSKYTHIYNWHNDSQMSASITLKGNDTSWYSVFKYNNENKLIEYKSFEKKKSASTWRTVYEYNEKGLKTKETVYGKKDKLISKIEYDYFEDDQKKETRTYDKKGKIKRVYNYTCEPKGKLADSKSEQLNYCVIKTKNEDGSFYEIIETHVDGKVNRQIYTYAVDSNMVKYEVFKPNGQLRYTTKYTYNLQGKTSSYQYYSSKGKLKYTEKYTFNEKGLMVNEDRFNPKNELVFSTRYSYSYFL
jgi:hypothetical protein